MIARLRGTPVASTPEGLLLDVGGVGYLVAATPSAVRLCRFSTAVEGADEVVVETYLHVREDAMQLYGFAERAERELFVQLLSVNGVGPKVALAIVSGSPADELRRAIVREDAARFQAIPGIGKKTAERIVLELKEKLAASVTIAPAAADDPDQHVVARDALIELGYSLADAERALASTDAAASPEERVRQALRRAA
jgi:Holliday junction DNA helicase RuvA